MLLNMVFQAADFHISLETILKPSDEFIDIIIAKLAVLHLHSFIAVQKAMHSNEV
jgi:hypothetical protein